jgi:hypothetical protein
LLQTLQRVAMKVFVLRVKRPGCTAEQPSGGLAVCSHGMMAGWLAGCSPTALAIECQ